MTMARPTVTGAMMDASVAQLGERVRALEVRMDDLKEGQDEIRRDLKMLLARPAYRRFHWRQLSAVITLAAGAVEFVHYLFRAR